MGGDAVCRAIAEMDPAQRLFDQIILAAPDIDRDVFRQQIVPRLGSKARRTTLYCSRVDWALTLSYAFNDSPRAGDSSQGILVFKELDTVDASDIDTDLLGHSYYGDCLPVIRDVGLLLEKNPPPPERDLKPAILAEGEPPYWQFPER